MYNFLKEFNEFERALGFGAPVNVRFNTPNTLDKMPSYWEKWIENMEGDTDGEEKGFKCVARTVGINPDDIKVSVEEYGILLEGSTEVEGKKYSQHIEMPISKEVMANVVAINYRSENGLTHIYLQTKTPEYKKIEVNKI